jgi:hypothetical protein
LAFSSRGSSQPSLTLLHARFQSLATSKAFIIHQTHCVSHCCCAFPHTAFLQSMHCIPTRKRPRNALVQQKSAELRANQEAGTGTEHGDNKSAEGGALLLCEPLPVWSLGFRIWGLGCGHLGFGIQVKGFGFRVSGFGFRVQGLGFRV